MQHVHSKPLFAVCWPKPNSWEEGTTELPGKNCGHRSWEEVVSFPQTTTVELSLMSLLCRAHSDALLKVNSC